MDLHKMSFPSSYFLAWSSVETSHKHTPLQQQDFQSSSHSIGTAGVDLLKLPGNIITHLFYPVSRTVGLMDQVSRSGVGSDVTYETASMGEYRWSSEEHEVRYRALRFTCP